jgi:hypothetical protein
VTTGAGAVLGDSSCASVPTGNASSSAMPAQAIAAVLFLGE